MPNTTNNELTLARYLVLNDAKELSFRINNILFESGFTNEERDDYFEKLMAGFLGEGKGFTKPVNISTKVLTEYVNLLNKLVVTKNVNGKPSETLYTNGLERNMLINKYRNLVRDEIVQNPDCLNLPSIEKVGVKTIMGWAKQVNADILEFNKNGDLDKFKSTYLLTDYASEIFEQSIANECIKLETEAEEEKARISSDKKIPGATKALMIEDVYRDRLNGKVFAAPHMAQEYLENVKQGLNSKLQFTYKSAPSKPKK